MAEVECEWRLVGDLARCPVMSKVLPQRRRATAVPAAAPATTKASATKSSKCPVMKMLFFLSSLLPSASGFAANDAVPRRAPRCPRSAAISMPNPKLCGAGPCHANVQAHLRMCTSAGAARPRSGTASMHTEWAGTPPKDHGGVLVLGAGWVGSRLARKLSDAGLEVHATNRPSTDPMAKDEYFRPVALSGTVQRHSFDLADPATWSSLPPPRELRAVVITFPVALPAVEVFWDEYLRHVPNVLVYSSTSVYQIDRPDQLVDEHTALKPSPRALAENFLQERGATVLTIAGIFGEPRGPRGVCSCLSAYLGSGGVPNGRKRVNMVHEEDIVSATCSCLHAAGAHRGSRINVAGENFELRELVAHCSHTAVDEGCAVFNDLSSKTVSSDFLLDEIMPADFAFVPPLGERRHEQSRLAAKATPVPVKVKVKA